MISLSFSMRELEYFLLILTRVTMFIYIAPFFNMNNTPNRVKIGLGFFISMLLYSVMTPRVYVEYTTLLQYTAIVLKEAVTGLLIGYAAMLCTTIVSFAGRMVDMEIGLSMVNQMDPTTKENVTITGVWYQYMVMLVLIVTGLHQYLIMALVETFDLIPINGTVFQLNPLMKSLIGFLSEYIVIGFRICLPVFTVMLLLNTVLGILAKVAPQMNMFAVGIQIKILVGLSTLFLTTSLLPGVSDFIFTEMKRMMVSIVEGLK